MGESQGCRFRTFDRSARCDRNPLVPKLPFGNARPETPFRVRFPLMTHTSCRSYNDDSPHCMASTTITAWPCSSHVDGLLFGPARGWSGQTIETLCLGLPGWLPRAAARDEALGPVFCWRPAGSRLFHSNSRHHSSALRTTGYLGSELIIARRWTPILRYGGTLTGQVSL
jgi:hypothetical protein